MSKSRSQLQRLFLYLVGMGEAKDRVRGVSGVEKNGLKR